ncbi:hypothetical protein [Tenacibaculum phage PTm5]|uniref:Uncharacterized protein n=1 Tax=Tenacibaculum phage PTm5 TaxID=2547426 RepID=A0A5S9BZ91_9CAUD|nr:hypothetical protein [Tenacibaculum phage PTm5]
MRYKGKVLHRWINDNNIGYYVHLTDVLEDFETIRDQLHRSKHRVFSLNSDRGLVKKINCFDFTLDMNRFNQNFKERYKNYTWYLPAVFVFPTKGELEKYLDRSNEILTERLTNSLHTLNKRNNRTR